MTRRGRWLIRKKGGEDSRLGSEPGAVGPNAAYAADGVPAGLCFGECSWQGINEIVSERKQLCVP
jgi:hypothetical protein